MKKNKKLGFTLAEVLIVIGIIGVVAALTLPNLNHATGDKEIVTRLQKAYSVLSEAVDRAVAVYGPMSSWCTAQCDESSDECLLCYSNRVSEFLKISKSCNQIGDSDSESYVSCEALSAGGNFEYEAIIYQLPDGMTVSLASPNVGCESNHRYVKDLCEEYLNVDVNGPTKGKNNWQDDQFRFSISDSLGVIPGEGLAPEESTEFCISEKQGFECTNWVLEQGNRDYLKADENGKCNDSNIILDGTTNTSCH